MKEEELEKIMPLKNGGQIKARHGLAQLSSLRTLLDEEPQHFRTLVAIVQGKEEGLDPTSVTFLRSYGYVGGTLDQEVRDILLSAYQETAEGPVLVNPFILADTSEAQALEQAAEQDLQRFMREVRKKIRRNEERGNNGGRSP